MKFFAVFWMLIGLWFLASAITEDGLLPSGHGFGRISEVLLGVAFIGYAVYRLRTGYRKAR